MKKFKKLTALLTGALLTVTSLGITAFAAEAPAEGNLIIHKYLMADVSQATEPGTGDEVQVMRWKCLMAQRLLTESPLTCIR